MGKARTKGRARTRDAANLRRPAALFSLISASEKTKVLPLLFLVPRFSFEGNTKKLFDYDLSVSVFVYLELVFDSSSLFRPLFL